MSVFRRFSRKDLEKDGENHSDKEHKKNKLSSKKKSKKGGNTKLQESALGLNQHPIYEEADKDGKPRANTFELPQPNIHEKSIEGSVKNRSKSMGEMMRQGNISGSCSGTEGIYHNLNSILDEEKTDDEEIDTQYSSIHAKKFELPPPLKGGKYAFDEIREILQPIDRDVLLNLVLNDICDKNNLKRTDESEEFVAINLLRQYLEQK